MVLALTLVVDSNILFAAAIKDGETARLILSDRLFLIAPERLFEEFKKYRELLLAKTHRSKEGFGKFLEIIEERIEVIPKAEFEPWLKGAEKKSSEGDFPFTALAKAYNCAVWSNDKELKELMEKSGFVSVFTTQDVINMLEL